VDSRARWNSWLRSRLASISRSSMTPPIPSPPGGGCRRRPTTAYVPGHDPPPVPHWYNASWFVAHPS
jgi:hypothetical protein